MFQPYLNLGVRGGVFPPPSPNGRGLPGPIDVVGFWFLDGKTDFKPEAYGPSCLRGATQKATAQPSVGRDQAPGKMGILGVVRMPSDAVFFSNSQIDNEGNWLRFPPTR